MAPFSSTSSPAALLPLLLLLLPSSTIHVHAQSQDVCGDGIITSPEECDSGDVGGATCESIWGGGHFTGGNLTCINAQCRFNTNNCRNDLCGNGRVDRYESCDGLNLNGQSCSSLGLGFTGGVLGCDNQCFFDTSFCVYENCGDGVATGFEPCDFNGQDLRRNTCRRLTGGNGTVICNRDCTLNYDSCIPPVPDPQVNQTCGNAILEGTEVCDQGNFTQNCANFGYNRGILRCNVATCTFNIDLCWSAPPTAQATPEEDDGLCFSGETTVQVLGTGIVQMKNLKVNDQVYTGNNIQGQPIYQPIYSFGHLDYDTPVQYLQIYHNATTTSHNKHAPLEISPAHMLYLANKVHPVRADSLQIGDILLHTIFDDSGTSTERVTIADIQRITRKGAYLPLSPNGNIVVNGIAASAYVSIDHKAPNLVKRLQRITKSSQHELFHTWMAPYRMICLGISSNLCQSDYGDNGIIHWLNFGQFLADFGEHQLPCMVQLLAAILVWILLGVVATMETILGARLGITCLAGLLCSVVLRAVSLGSRVQTEKKKKVA